MFKSKQTHKLECKKCHKKVEINALKGLTVFTTYKCECGYVIDIFNGKTPILKINGVTIKPFSG